MATVGTRATRIVSWIVLALLVGSVISVISRVVAESHSPQAGWISAARHLIMPVVALLVTTSVVVRRRWERSANVLLVLVILLIGLDFWVLFAE
jgi:cell division protein FtsW (lipid II flippase)